MIVTDEKHYRDIAGAIRGLTGSTELYQPGQMAAAIASAGGTEPGISLTQLQAMLERTVTHMDIPEGTTKIGTRVFQENTQMASVTLPDSLVALDTYAFYGCSALEITALPVGMTTLGDSCLRSTPITLGKLPDGLETIGAYAFCECENLTVAEIPASVVSVGNQAFSKCYSLTTVTFLGTPQSLGRSIFSYCSAMTELRVPWSEGALDNAPWGLSTATIIYDYTG